MKLYTYYRSSASWRVRILLHLKGIAFESVAVNLAPGVSEQRGAEHRLRNPMAQVPILEWHEAGEVRRLSQSVAIALYLESVHPEPPILPSGAYERARALQLAELVNSGVQPFQNTGTLARLESLGVAPQPWARGFIERGLAALEIEAGREPREYLASDRPSIADAFLVPQLFNARRFDVPTAAYPRLLEIESRCAELPAFVAAHPDAQPDRPSG